MPEERRPVNPPLPESDIASTGTPERTRVVVSVFTNSEQANEAAEQLHSVAVGSDAIMILRPRKTGGIVAIGDLLASGPLADTLLRQVHTNLLMEWGLPSRLARPYAETVRDPQTVIAVQVPQDRAEAVADLLDAHGAIEMDIEDAEPVEPQERADKWATKVEPQRHAALEIGSFGHIRVEDGRRLLAAIERAYNSFLVFERLIDSAQNGHSAALFNPPARLAASQWRDFISSEDRLVLGRVRLSSPGILQFLGALNPLEFIRKILADRHERRKDNQYRNAAEQDRLQLEN
jgi:hypothetical protein